MKLDILAFGAHPDDVEMSCSGTLMKHIAMKKRAGIVDLTRGEMGTRGTPEIRNEETKKSVKIIGVHVRENLGMRDGFFRNDEEHQLEIVKMIRLYRPEVILANAPIDRHPDHGRAAELVRDANFLSGLRKVDTQWKGKSQEEWRAKAVYHYIQDKDLEPDFLIDITEFFERKIKAIQAFKSQFYDPKSKEPVTYISRPDFLEALVGRHRIWGKAIGVGYAEGFIKNRYLGVKNILDLQ